MADRGFELNCGIIDAVVHGFTLVKACRMDRGITVERLSRETGIHTARFSTRRDAEMVVERLVQEHGVARGDLFIHPAGPENTAGAEIGGSDRASGEPGTETRRDAALNGVVLVSAEIDDAETLSKVRDVFLEFGAMED